MAAVVTVRKGFMCRWPAELVERVDAARGPLSRNAWLEDVVRRELDALERSEQARDPGVQFGSHATRQAGGLFSRTVRDEDGSDLGLQTSRRADGVLEISRVPASTEGADPADVADPDAGQEASGDWGDIP